MNLDENTFARMIDRAGGDDAPRPEHREQLRRQVLATFDRAQAEATRPTFRTRSLTNLRWIMRHPVSRATAAAIFVLAVIGVVLWFHGGGATPAFADFMESILEAKTAKYKMTIEIPKEKPVTAETLFMAPNRTRMEYQASGQPRMITINDHETGTRLTLVPEKKLAFVATVINMPKERQPAGFFSEIRAMLLDAAWQPGFQPRAAGRKRYRRTSCHRLPVDRPWGGDQPVGRSEDRTSDPHRRAIAGVRENERDGRE